MHLNSGISRIKKFVESKYMLSGKRKEIFKNSWALIISIYMLLYVHYKILRESSNMKFQDKLEPYSF